MMRQTLVKLPTSQAKTSSYQTPWPTLMSRWTPFRLQLQLNHQYQPPQHTTHQRQAILRQSPQLNHQLLTTSITRIHQLILLLIVQPLRRTAHKPLLQTRLMH